MKLSTYYLFTIRPLLFALVLTCSMTTYSQDKPDAYNAFKAYTESAREVAYLHLNKSAYLTGESVGFTAYVLDKASKKPSLITTNLYCVITDKDQNITKQQLIKITNGTGSGVFNVDSTFTNGTYEIKAFTNWMKNFKEHNHFSQKIQVIDLNQNNKIESKSITRIVDAQFLPEGGHLVANTSNIIGVVIKDTLGFGVPNVVGDILDNNNTSVGHFKTNQLGIGKFLLVPKPNIVYTAKVDVNNSSQEFKLSAVKTKGICMSLSALKDKVAMSISTNESTLPSIAGKSYKLTIHNGKDLKTIHVSFSNNTTIKQVIADKDLFAGINVFTLFDDQMNPLLERLYFNHSGINIISSSENYTFDQYLDSINVTLPLNLKTQPKSGNFSVSILPEDTKSYKHHHNIISYTFLKPYIKGTIENAHYYFKDIDRKKKYELDNLLITQGWSSYDWNTIFEGLPEPLYNFENGISLMANISKKETGQYVIFPTKLNTTDLISLEEGKKSFIINGFYPSETESIKIGEINKKGKVDKPSIYLQFGLRKFLAIQIHLIILQ